MPAAVSISMPEDLADALEKYSTVSGVPKSVICQRLVAAWIARDMKSVSLPEVPANLMRANIIRKGVDRG